MPLALPAVARLSFGARSLPRSIAAPALLDSSGELGNNGMHCHRPYGCRRHNGVHVLWRTLPCSRGPWEWLCVIPRLTSGRDAMRRQRQAACGSSSRPGGAAAVVVMAAAAGSRGKALISVSDKTGLDVLAKVGAERRGAGDGGGLCDKLISAVLWLCYVSLAD